MDRQAQLIAHHCAKPGFRGRINAKCIECIYDPHAEGTWRQQVEECTSYACPLYPVRPTSTVGDDADNDQENTND